MIPRSSRRVGPTVNQIFIVCGAILFIISMIVMVRAVSRRI